MPENGTKNTFRDNQTTYRVALIFLDVECLRKGNINVFTLCQQTNKAHCMYLPFQKLEK